MACWTSRRVRRRARARRRARRSSRACSRRSATGTLIGFAHEGGQLPVAPSWSSEDIVKNVVALHDGKVVFARSEAELLRALATRTLRQNVVVYLGAASQLDDELAACAVTVVPHVRGAESRAERAHAPRRSGERPSRRAACEPTPSSRGSPSPSHPRFGDAASRWSRTSPCTATSR